MSTTGALHTSPTAEPLEWERWRAARLAAATAPHGIAAARATVWLDAAPQVIDGVPGSWFVEHGRVRASGGEGLALSVGDTATLGEVLVRVLARNGVLAVRVFDPAAPTRTGLSGIDAFRWDRSWRLDGVFEPEARELRVQQIDGGETGFPVAGSVTFSIDGSQHSVLGFRTDQGVQITFADASNGRETQQFRFLDVVLPAGHEARQPVVIDFNLAYLPPCAFAPAYLCPLPPPQNRLAVPVRAGEQRLRHADGGDALPGL